MAKAKSASKLRVTLVKSLIGTRDFHRQSVHGLGLRRLNQSVELQDSPAIRGMIHRAAFLLKCEEI